MRNGRFQPAPPPELAVSVNSTPELCTILVTMGAIAQQLVLSLDDAEGVANLILAKVKEGREGKSPIVLVPPMGGLKQ